MTLERCALPLKAAVWRRLMMRTRFVAVTGSCGKSTATACLAAILASRFPTNSPESANNSWRALAQRVLQTRRHHRFAVIEVGTKLPGALRRAAWMIAPDVVVVLQVARVHSNNFPDLGSVAAEKALLFSRQSRSGLVILNGDNPHVLSLREKCRGRVRTFGASPHNDLRVSDVSARWPERLRFRVHYGGETAEIRTNLVGDHWAPSVAGAILAAVSLGVTLREAAAAVETVQPLNARMEPSPLPSGVMFLRDDYSATYATLPPALRVLRQARAARRILITGDPDDGAPNVRERLKRLGTSAAEAAELAIFIGPDMEIARQASLAAGLDTGAAAAFERWRDAAGFLLDESRPGDLVLLRSSMTGHTERVYFRQLGSVACDEIVCRKLTSCDTCPRLGFQPLDTGPASLTARATDRQTSRECSS